MAPPSITVSRGPSEQSAYTWSPFVTKLEVRLRFGGLAYDTDKGAPPQGPRGKIPYARISKEHASSSETVSDSTLISQKLVDESWVTDLNGNLPAAMAARDLALRALLEDKLYFYHVS